MAFSILGTTKREKIGNILGLIVLVFICMFLLSKAVSIDINTEFEIVHTETVIIENPKLSSRKLVEAAIHNYKINDQQALVIARNAGISADDYRTSVKMEVSIPTDIAQAKEITLEFITKKKRPEFEPLYQFVASDMQKYLAN